MILAVFATLTLPVLLFVAIVMGYVAARLLWASFYVPPRVGTKLYIPPARYILHGVNLGQVVGLLCLTAHLAALVASVAIIQYLYGCLI